MTKKDYILIATAINEARTSLMYASVNPGETKRTLETVIDTLGLSLFKDNPNFNICIFKHLCNEIY